MIRTDRLAAFVVFAEELSFTHAAKRLRLSQPALHVQIGNLASDLGVALYVREGRALRLTEAGERVAAFGRELASRTDAFLADLHGVAPQQPVVLCAGEAITRYRLVPAIRSVSIPLRLVLGDAEHAVRMVLSGRAHVGIVGAMPPREGLAARPLLTVPQMLAVPDSHPLARGGEDATLEALAGCDLAVPPPGRPHREALERALAAAGIPWRVAVEVQGWDLMVRLVAAGLGLAVVNGIVTAPEGVVLLPLRDLPPVRYDVVVREGSPPVPAVRQLLEALTSAV